MKIQTLCILIAFLSVGQTVKAIDWYSEGDTLYNWANGGLNIRAEYNKSGNVLGIIPYGEPVVVVSMDHLSGYPKKTVRIGIFNGEIELSGDWVKVSYNGITGYVFDGYLSRFLAPEKSINNFYPYSTNWEQIDSYLERVFGIVHHSTSNQHGEIWIDQNYYNQGIVHTWSRSTGFAYQRYVLPEFSLEEILIFFKNVYWQEEPPVLKSKINENFLDQYTLYEFDELQGYLRIIYLKNVVIVEIYLTC